MATQELSRLVRSEEGISHAALTMAVGIVVERVQRLPPEDKSDLCDLLKSLVNSSDDEERESIVGAILEILDQRPILLKEFSLDDAQPSPGLKKWIDYVSGRIREARKEAGLTQQELAEKAGLPQSHISRLESAKHSPSGTTIEKIANALGKPVAFFDPSE